MSLTAIITLGSEICTFIGLIIAFVVWFKKIIEGIRCQLRSEMLRTYYHCQNSKTIRQYEKENFIKLYDAYKALKGNSFIDDIYEDIKEWEVIS